MLLRGSTLTPNRLQEARSLMNNKTEMSLKDLLDLLLHSDVVRDFDPLAEAFKVGPLASSKDWSRTIYSAAFVVWSRTQASEP